MSEKFGAEEVFRLFLDSPNSKDGDREIFSYLLDYLSNFEDDESLDDALDGAAEKPDKKESFVSKGILFEDFSSYELDDFLNFYLEDNFENFTDLQKRSIDLFKKFSKFALGKKILSPEENKEWGEVLNG